MLASKSLPYKKLKSKTKRKQKVPETPIPVNIDSNGNVKYNHQAYVLSKRLKQNAAKDLNMDTLD